MAKRTAKKTATKKAPAKRTAKKAPRKGAAKGGDNFGNALEAMEDGWADANESEFAKTGGGGGSFVDEWIEKGVYIVQLIAAKFGMGNKGPYFTMTIVVGTDENGDETEFENQKYSIYNSFDNKKVLWKDDDTGEPVTSMKLFVKELRAMGIDPTKIKPAQFSQLAKKLGEEQPEYYAYASPNCETLEDMEEMVENEDSDEKFRVRWNINKPVEA
jgi:hypothetical protein